MRLDHETLERAQEALGYRFRDLSLLDSALTHASITDSRLDSNERLEFLGDAVLGMIVCDYLFRNYPDLLEGDLTKIKSAAVSRRMCAKIATNLKIDSMLLLGKGMKTRAALPSSLAAAVLESVIGAIYLDAGVPAVTDFLIPLLSAHIDQAAMSGHQQNFKSVLQHVAQEHFDTSPSYQLLDEKGPDHAKCFEIAVDMGGRQFPSCWAASKKQAEQQAALKALEVLGFIRHTDDGHVLFVSEQGEEEIMQEASDPSLHDAAGDDDASDPVDACVEAIEDAHSAS